MQLFSARFPEPVHDTDDSYTVGFTEFAKSQIQDFVPQSLESLVWIQEVHKFGWREKKKYVCTRH